MTDTGAQSHNRHNCYNGHQLYLGVTIDVKADLRRRSSVILINTHIPRNVILDNRLFNARHGFVEFFLKTKIQGDPPLTFLLVWGVSP